MLILSKVSFPHGFDEMPDYLRQTFGNLAAGRVAVVFVVPKGGDFSTMEGAKLTVLSASNFEHAASEIDSAYRAFARHAIAPERLYLAHACVDAAYLDCLRSGAGQPDSLDASTLARLLRAA